MQAPPGGGIRPLSVVEGRRTRWDTATVSAGEIGWFVVTTDDQSVHLSVTPPGRPAWQAVLPWDSIVRVCFAAEDPFTSDGLYLFTSLRSESWAVPVEAVGGTSLLQELIRRRLFDPGLAIRAMTALSGLFCWPDDALAPDTR
jgi:hypothetical protein